MKETWKPVNHKGKTYLNYKVSNLGNVWKIKDNKILKPVILKTGVHYSYLVEGKKNIPIHLLVWQSFKGKIKEGFLISHKDGDKYNNRLENLEKITHRQKQSKDNGLPIGVLLTKSGTFRSSIRLGKKKLHLGIYLRAINADKAYEIAYKLIISGKCTDEIKIKEAVNVLRKKIRLKPLLDATRRLSTQPKPKHIIYNW